MTERMSKDRESWVREYVAGHGSMLEIDLLAELDATRAERDSVWATTPGSVVVTRHVGYEPDAWLLHCYALNIQECVLGTKNIEEAKTRRF